jgi:hypothetical protein
MNEKTQKLNALVEAHQDTISAEELQDILTAIAMVRTNCRGSVKISFEEIDGSKGMDLDVYLPAKTNKYWRRHETPMPLQVQEPEAISQ